MKNQKHIIYLSMLLFLFSSCATPVIRSIQHTPLHADNNTGVTFKVKAGSNSEITRVTLNIYEYELYVAANNMRSARQRPGGQWGEAHVWNLSGSNDVDLNFNYAAGFPAGSFVYYQFVVRNSKNKEAQKTIIMQAGTSPWGDSEVVLYSASEQAPNNTIDICFVPDGGDYGGNIRQFLTDIESTIYNGYLTNNMIKTNAHQWSFYYTPATGVASTRTLPAAVASSPLIDVFGIIHSNTFRDARQGNVFTTEHFNIGTAVHETAHAVFDLKDEYCCDSFYEESCNLWSSRADCEASAIAAGGTAADCASVVTDNNGTFFKPEPDALNCIMFDDGDATMRDFGRVCQRCISSFYIELDNR